MHRSARAALTAATALTLGTAAAVVVAGSPAGAAGTCSAYAAMPSSVTATSTRIVLRPKLVGSAACYDVRFDSGATAQFVGNGQRPYEQRWTSFGDSEYIDLNASLTPAGTYSITAGNVQVFDRNEERVPFTWRTTSVTVRFGSKLAVSARSDAGVTASLSAFTGSRWAAKSGTTVSLQRRSGTTWRTVASSRTNSRGSVRIAHSTGGSSLYRLVTSATGSLAAAVRGL